MIKEQIKRAEDLTRVFRHVVGGILTSWRRTFQVGLVTGASALLVAEIVACFVTASLPPPPITHLVAAMLALALGYSAAITMLIGILLKGGITLIRQLEGEVEIGADTVGIFTRHKAGGLGADIDIRRVADNRQANTTISRPSAEGPRAATGVRGVAVSAVGTAVGRKVAHAAVSRGTANAQAWLVDTQPDARRDPDDAIMRTPAPASQSVPVPASRMPRIEWASDEAMQLSPIPAQLFKRAPWRDAPQAPDSFRAAADQHATFAASGDGGAQPLVAKTDMRVPALREASKASGRTPDVPGFIPRPRGRHHPASVMRPLPQAARPSRESDGMRLPGGVHSGDLWKRVSQVLVGQSKQPSPREDAHTSKSRADDEATPADA